MIDPGRQKAVTGAIWKTMTLAYTEPGDRSGKAVPIPVREAVSALLTCVANVVMSVDSAKERQSIISAASPSLYRTVAAGRATTNLIIPPNQGIVLEN